jgi:hypothetical protein
MIFSLGANLELSIPGTRQVYPLNFIFTKPEGMVSDWEIPTEPVIVGLMLLFIG